MATNHTARSVGRERFLPETIWVPAHGSYRAVSRLDEPDVWLAAASADEPVVTQVDDGATPRGRLGGWASSSSSQPSLVSAMIEATGLAPARCQVTRGAGSHPVAQYGPRRLWDEVGQAHAWWTEQGKPGVDRFGLTVTGTARHSWLDRPAKLVA